MSVVNLVLNFCKICLSKLPQYATKLCEVITNFATLSRIGNEVGSPSSSVAIKPWMVCMMSSLCFLSSPKKTVGWLKTESDKFNPSATCSKRLTIWEASIAISPRGGWNWK